MGISWRRGGRHRGDVDAGNRGLGAHGHESAPIQDLEERLAAYTSPFERPPTAEELRASFRAKRLEEEPEAVREAFTTRFTTESLFTSTAGPVDEDPVAEDRSGTRGDYFYDPEDAWAVLGLEPGSSWSDVVGAHRRLALLHHPDRHPDSDDVERQTAEATMRDVNVAYSALRRLNGG